MGQIRQRVCLKRSSLRTRSESLLVAHDSCKPRWKHQLRFSCSRSPFRIGELLSRYRSGPLPKPFKLLPSLPQWARLLAITSPADWTPHATYAATKIFVSNLKPKQATVFLRGILLERVRDDMAENNGKLNYQLYEALKKALYKPAAFFKGILFPICEVSGTHRQCRDQRKQWAGEHHD